MALTIYGSPRSRTLRVLWAAAELNLVYEHIPVTWDDPVLKGDGFLRLNPAGTIPTIVDDDVAVAESMAINLYLAKKYGSQGRAPLYLSDPAAEAQVWRWCLWAQGHLEPWVQQDARLSDLREATREAAAEEIARVLTTLDPALSHGAWLVGDHFTVADLNVAAVLSPSRAAHLDLRPYPHVRAWLFQCYDRPAARATRQKFSG